MTVHELCVPNYGALEQLVVNKRLSVASVRSLRPSRQTENTYVRQQTLRLSFSSAQPSLVMAGAQLHRADKWQRT